MTAFDWLIFRVVLCPIFKDSYHTIRYKWTLRDLADAHVAIDIHEALQPDPPRAKK